MWNKLARQTNRRVVVSIAAVVIIAMLGASGWLIYHFGYQTPAADGYLHIKEWGIKLPLSHSIKDAYYIVSDSSEDVNGEPDTMWLGLTSLNRSGCDAYFANKGQDTQLGAILRGLPTDTDPVSGAAYPQLYSNGVTIGKYYFAYASATKGQTCAPAATLQSIDAAFATAMHSAAEDTTR